MLKRCSVEGSNPRLFKISFRPFCIIYFFGGNDQEIEFREIESHIFSGGLKQYLDFRSPEKIVIHKFDHEIES